MCIVDSVALSKPVPSGIRRSSNSVISNLHQTSVDDEQLNFEPNVIVKQELAGDCDINVEPRRKEVTIDCDFSEALDSRRDAARNGQSATFIEAKENHTLSSSEDVHTDSGVDTARENRPPVKTGIPPIVLTSCYWSRSTPNSLSSLDPCERITLVPLAGNKERNVGPGSRERKAGRNADLNKSLRVGGVTSDDERMHDETNPVQDELCSSKNVVGSAVESTLGIGNAEPARYSKPQMRCNDGARVSASESGSSNVDSGLNHIVAEQIQHDELGNYTVTSSVETPSICPAGELTQPQRNEDVAYVTMNASGDAANDAERGEVAAKVGPEANRNGSADDCATSSVVDNGETTTVAVRDLESDLAALIKFLQQSSFASDPFHCMTQDEMDALEADGKLKGMPRRHLKIFHLTKKILNISASCKEHAKTSVHQVTVTLGVDSCLEDDKAATRRVCLDLHMLYLVSLKCGYRAKNVIIVLPDELRLRSECGKYISAEGVPLFPRKQSVPVSSWFRLLALVRMINELEIVDAPLAKTQEDRLRRLHEIRRRTLADVCCTTEDQRKQVIERLHRNLALYRYVCGPQQMCRCRFYK